MLLGPLSSPKIFTWSLSKCGLETLSTGIKYQLFPGLLAGLPQRCHLFWEWGFPPEFVAARGGFNLAFQTLLAMLQDGLAWWELRLELPAGLF